MTADWGVPTFRTTARAARPRAAGLRHRVGAVGGRRPEATRELVAARRAGAGRDAARARPGRVCASLWADVGGSGLVQVAEQYLLMPGHAARLARGPRRRDRRADLGPGLLDAPVPRGLADPRAARRRLRAGRRSARARSPRRWPTRSRRDGWTRRRHAAARRHHARDARLRRADGALRLHRQPVVEPAARPPDRGPRLARRAGRRPRGPPGRPDARRWSRRSCAARPGSTSTWRAST